jgi:hypothetical protein
LEAGASGRVKLLPISLRLKIRLFYSFARPYLLWKNLIVNKICRYAVLMSLCGMLALTASAQGTITLHPKNGQPVTGTILDMGDQGIRLQMADGTFMDKPIPWGLLSLDDLQQLQNDPKADRYVEPFIPVPRAEKLQKTEVPHWNQPPRLDKPEAHSLFGALGTSGVGVLMFLLIYAGNIYAAYEIAIFRAQPLGLVCGVAAVVPIIGPVIFLAMPTRERHTEYHAQPATDDNLEAAIAAEQQASPSPAPGPQRAPTQPVATAPASNVKTFVRGQYTFNRRFFETQVSGFFAMIRPEAVRNAVLTFKSARGTHVVQRITRISPNEIYIQVQKGHASEEVIIPFVEIQEVLLQN